MKKYIVTLTAEERQALGELIAAGKAAALKLAHARILLKADAAEGGPAWPDRRIAEAIEVSPATIERVRQRFVEQGLEAAGRPQVLDDAAAGRQAGRAGGRPLDLRRDRSTLLEKSELKPHLKEQWCIPPEANAEFVAAMEDVLEVYHRPYDETRPLI